MVSIFYHVEKGKCYVINYNNDVLVDGNEMVNGKFNIIEYFFIDFKSLWPILSPTAIFENVQFDPTECLVKRCCYFLKRASKGSENDFSNGHTCLDPC